MKLSLALQSKAYPFLDVPGTPPSGQATPSTLSRQSLGQAPIGSTLTPMYSNIVSVAESWGLRGEPSLARVQSLSGYSVRPIRVFTNPLLGWAQSTT